MRAGLGGREYGRLAPTSWVKMQCSVKEEMPRSLQTIYLVTETVIILAGGDPAGEAGRPGDEFRCPPRPASLHGPLPKHADTLSSRPILKEGKGVQGQRRSPQGRVIPPGERRVGSCLFQSSPSIVITLSHALKQHLLLRKQILQNTP